MAGLWLAICFAVISSIVSARVGGTIMANIRGTNRPDTLSGTAGDDRINAKNGADVVYAGDGDDTILGGSGADTIFGGGDDDYIDGGNYADDLRGEAGDDTILGGRGADRLDGGTGNDILDGQADDDELFGRDGDDTLYGLQGNDGLYGGTGNDVFYVHAGNHTIVGGEDADGKDIDILDLTGAGNHTVTYTGPESGFVEFFDSNGVLTHTATFKEIERVICFTPGTSIATMEGEKPVESLRVGDSVFTRDNGAQKISWVGRKKITLGQGTLSQKLQPILIRKGALGFGLPERDLLVSPNHRVLVTSKIAQLLFEENEVLVAAKHLVGTPGIEFWVAAEVEYVHFLCENHEVVLSNGAWTESFQPGDYSLGALGEYQREEIFTLFPELREKTAGRAFGAVRRTLRRYEAELLLQD